MGDLFKDRIDLNYVAENGRAGEYERHRAIKILRPTTELSGLYKCKVSSFVDEDFLTARMVVFGEWQSVSRAVARPRSYQEHMLRRSLVTVPPIHRQSTFVIMARSFKQSREV